MDYLRLEDLNSNSCTEKNVRLHFPEFYDYLLSTYPQLPHRERLYWFYHNLTSHPVCPVCGRLTAFINTKQGYREFCSNRCLGKSDAVKKRREETSLKHYGTANPMKDKAVQETLKKNNLLNYGVENAYQREDVKEKIRKTNLKKLGVEYPMQSREVVNKMLDSRIQKIIKDDPNILSISDGIYTYKCPHPYCHQCIEKTFTISSNTLYDRKNWGTELCTRLLPVQDIHNEGTSLELFVRDILDKHRIEYICNDRNILEGRELDLYIPSKKIAIECNGIYWHSKTNPSYHVQKFLDCQQQGIQLITLWEDWIKNKPGITASLVKSKLGIYDRRVGARQCIIKEIDKNTCDTFLNNNHIQCQAQGSRRYGLFLQDELLSVMVFNESNIMGVKNQKRWELVRYCSLLHTQVIGGAEKLFKYFLKDHNSEIVSFSSNDISQGQLYDKLGFRQAGVNKKTYWYFQNLKRYHRSSFTKDAIVKRGWKPNKEGWTEAEVMQEHKFLRIYDSGQTKWVYRSNR